jgi:DNA (cytosine-5)-methyltransferase 1
VTAYYNEIDPFAAQWLRNLIAAGLIAPGEVDERSIVDVRPEDLDGYTQCHFFAGLGGWAYAARLAGWPDDRPLWTASAPCQPFSVAGKQKGTTDERHLWPEAFRLIRARRPDVVVGEQVAAAVGKDWLDGVFADLEGVGYACGAVVVPACAVDAPHRRDRLWFVADANVVGVGQERQQRGGELCRAGGDPQSRAPSPLGDTDGARSTPRLPAPDGRHEGLAEVADDGSDRRLGAWGECAWLIGADGKARRVEPSIRLLAHGIPGRVGRLRAYGNAIVPQIAAEVIRAYLNTEAFK